MTTELSLYFLDSKMSLHFLIRWEFNTTPPPKVYVLKGLKIKGILHIDNKTQN